MPDISKESKNVETREKKVKSRFPFFRLFWKKKKTPDNNSIPTSISLEPDILWSRNSVSDRSQQKSKKRRHKKRKQLTTLEFGNNSWDTVRSPIFTGQNQSHLPTLDDLDHQLDEELISSMTLHEKSVAEKSNNDSHDVEGDIVNDGHKNSTNYPESADNNNDELNADKETRESRGYLKYLMDLNLDSYDSTIEYAHNEGNSTIESNQDDEKMPISRYNYLHSSIQNRSMADINGSLRQENNEEIGRNLKSQILGTPVDHNATSEPLENNQLVIPPRRRKHTRVLSIRGAKKNIRSVFQNHVQSEQGKTTRNFDHLQSHLIPKDLEIIPELESENSYGSGSRKERSLKTLVVSHEKQIDTSSNSPIINELRNQMAKLQIPNVDEKNILKSPFQQHSQSPPDRFDELTASYSSPLSTIDKSTKIEESQKVLKELWSELSIIFFNIQGKLRHRLCQAPESCHVSDPESCRKGEESPKDHRPLTLRIKRILEQMMQEIDKSLEDDILYGAV